MGDTCRNHEGRSPEWFLQVSPISSVVTGVSHFDVRTGPRQDFPLQRGSYGPLQWATCNNGGSTRPFTHLNLINLIKF